VALRVVLALKSAYVYKQLEKSLNSRKKILVFELISLLNENFGIILLSAVFEGNIFKNTLKKILIF
jgi:hypothetical protein